MATLWYECEECVFGSNSKKEAGKHITETGHKVTAEKEES